MSLFSVMPHLEVIEKAVKNNSFNKREGAYVRAVQLYASGDLIKATDEFMAMLRDYPLGELHDYGSKLSMASHYAWGRKM